MKAITTTKNLIKICDRCLLCDNTDLMSYMDFGEQALANGFLHHPPTIHDKEFTAPLELLFCPQCSVSHLRHIVDRKRLFDYYYYFSAASKPLERHFETYASQLARRFPQQIKNRVVEIGSNDGLLLKKLQKFGARCLGVDPAMNVVSASSVKGIEVIIDYFSTAVARRILNEHGAASIIIANNVLPHVDDIQDVIAAVKLLLEANGIFVFEVNYMADILEHNEFTNVYHEHVYYFTVTSLVRLMHRYEMDIFDIQHIEAQGGSLRVFVQHRRYKELAPIVQRYMESEHRTEITSTSPYKEFQKRTESICRIFRDTLRVVGRNRLIIGCGASAKGNVLLQYASIDNDVIRFIVDTTPAKQNMLAPGTHIPIISPRLLHEYKPDFFVVLAWNYLGKIVGEYREYLQSDGGFIIPLPSPTVLWKRDI